MPEPKTEPPPRYDELFKDLKAELQKSAFDLLEQMLAVGQEAA